MDAPAPLAPALTETPRAAWWLRLFGRIVEPWLQIRREPANVRAQIDPARPVIYVTERYGLSDTLILEQACREAGLPEPLQPLQLGPLRRPRAMFALARREPWLIGRRKPRSQSQTLTALFGLLRAYPDLDAQLV